MKIIRVTKENKMAEFINQIIYTPQRANLILEMIKTLPKSKYIIEMFESCDNKHKLISFDKDLYLKISLKDVPAFEKKMGFKVKDHLKVSFK